MPNPRRDGEAGTPKGFAYVAANNVYLGLAQSPLELARALMASGDPLFQDQGSLARGYRALRHAARLFGRRGQTLTLPVGGTLALARESAAAKVFDLPRRRVHTVLPPDELQRRFEAARRVSGAPFAPTVYGLEPEKGYYSEELVLGRHPDDRQPGAFAAVYLPLLAQILAAQPVRQLPLAAYAARLLGEIRAPGSLLARLEPGARAQHERVLAQLGERLSASTAPLPLTLSHGDLFSENVVICGGAARAIDWGRAGERSPLFDLYFLFLNSFFKHAGAAALAPALEAAVAALRRALPGERLALLEPAVTSAPRYRWLFYLEASHMLLAGCDRDPAVCAGSQARRLARYLAFEAFLRSAGRAALD